VRLCYRIPCASPFGLLVVESYTLCFPNAVLLGLRLSLDAPAAVVGPEGASEVVCWVRAPTVGTPFGAVTVRALEVAVCVSSLGVFFRTAEPASRLPRTGLLIVIVPATSALRDSGFIGLADDGAPRPKEGDPGCDSVRGFLLHGEDHHA